MLDPLTIEGRLPRLSECPAQIMKRLRVFLRLSKFVFLSASLAGSACFHAGAAVTHIVTYGSFFFNPKTITINVGDTVLWTNSSGTHTLLGTGSDPICSGAALPCGHTFNTPGTFAYECTVPGHAGLGMTGTVVVVSTTLAPARLTNAMRLPNGQFQFTIIGTANHTNTIQASTNLLNPTNWIALSTTVPATNTFTFTDSNAPALQLRFYRVVEPP